MVRPKWSNLETPKTMFAKLSSANIIVVILRQDHSRCTNNRYIEIIP